MFRPESGRAPAFVAQPEALPVSTPAADVPDVPDVPPQVVSDEFRDTVRKYVASERRMAELGAEMKQTRQDNAELKEAICKFMEDMDIDHLCTREMRLKLKTSAVKTPLKKAELRDRVSAYLGGDDKAVHFFAQVFESDRATVERTSLRKLKVPARQAA